MTSEACPLTAFTLFCDDLRQEAGGKLSAMGIYQGVMAIPADAVLLPKLVAWSVFKLPVSQVDGLATVLLQDKDRVLSSATLDFAQSEQLGAHALSSDQADALEMLNIPFELTPFRAQVGMEIRVVFESTKFHYESDVLHIVKAA
ncbi:hypothetical protein [Limnohabitans planktonicus]|jgi:hypothetical protein|uniref:Uncharacterized protein n=1 Tax=Limnohabitans planktonicus II-D5 TaxID=1293045 RepID=A0A2T7UEM6_9BURK|nr:hypothetical protein [Limnohabitans planktonicus]PVE43156.1 hypothetical protein H663_009055 [Limnohabitans planktonicus II-D5]